MRGLSSVEACILRQTIPGSPERRTEEWEEPVIRGLVRRGLVTEHEDAARLEQRPPHAEARRGPHPPPVPTSEPRATCGGDPCLATKENAR